MTLREFYVQRLRTEAPVFLRIFDELPAGRLGYKPHERSPSAEQLAWTLTGTLASCIDVVKDKRAEWKSLPAPPLAEMRQLFEGRVNELAGRVEKLDEAAWDAPAKFYYGGKLVSEQPVGMFLWFVLFDAIHHRGQLAAYLRPMGAKVPGIYGPSADEPARAA
jgi:uncharacterized damage-inducible protein DinB